MREKFHLASYFLNNRSIKNLQQVSEFLRVSPHDVMGRRAQGASYKPSSQRGGAFDSGFFRIFWRGKPQGEGEEGTDRRGGWVRTWLCLALSPPPMTQHWWLATGSRGKQHWLCLRTPWSYPSSKIWVPVVSHCSVWFPPLENGRLSHGPVLSASESCCKDQIGRKENCPGSRDQSHNADLLALFPLIGNLWT